MDTVGAIDTTSGYHQSSNTTSKEQKVITHKKLLVICGPTATGKTHLGFLLAKKFDGEIVSADSRQVYKHMDIGTGKEWDKNIKIWGYDLVDPKDEFSVSDYFNQMKQVVSDIWDRDKLPIIVGGTGLYIKSLIDGIPTVDIPKNEELRKNLGNLSLTELYEKLATLDSLKVARLNSSDKKNPRRLIRAIEVAVWNIENETQKKIVDLRDRVLDDDVEVLMIGLKSSKENLFKNIKNRVEKRVNEGFIDEIESLLKMGVSWKNQSMKSLGYKEAEAFFKEGQTYEEFIENWERNEMKYVKRQITWFKKDKRIVWFYISDKNFLENIENLVSKWNLGDLNGIL
ncbi:MAG: tRNA (adenosine(37)-N6)-dimethylallyltransferase MiaA [bacterium]|nr:MAG: tRNA (adenosine(37)-N6)-dimethylallyltransferase MiaA [bacterium]